MTRRVLAGLVGVTLVAGVTVTGQSTPLAVPLAPDGHPDLQGVWLNNRVTPLERPKKLAGRATITDAELAVLKERAARLFDNHNNADFAAGDAVFLSALDDIDHFTSTTATGTTSEMIEREWDNRTSLIIDPPDGLIPSLTADAQHRRAERAAARRRPPEGPEDFTQIERCLTYGVPRISTTNTGAGPLGYYQIVQTPSAVVLFLEAIHETRIVHLDRAAHPVSTVEQWEGDSRGHWEGATLVVDTTNFSKASDFMGSSDHLHLVERFTRIAPNALDYQVTIDDATTWTRPWTVLIHMTQSSQQLYEYACHEGNVNVISNMLAGARAGEKAR